MNAVTLLFDDGRRIEYCVFSATDAEALFDVYPRLASVTVEHHILGGRGLENYLGDTQP